MTDSIEERFYALLPQLYRSRDYLQGQPLRALLAVLEGEYQALKADMEATYDNWFVDTCDQWVLPYIADLVGIRGLSHDQHLFPTQRRLVANALAYRRRKGTAAVLEHVLRDVSGWHIRVVEFFQLLSVTQHLADIRPDAGRSTDLRETFALAQVGGAFERFARTVDVRGTGGEPVPSWPSGTARQAKYHPATLGIFVWRTRAYLLEDTFARPISRPVHQGCFTFDAAGRSVPLFNRPQAVDDILDRAEAQNLAIPLSRALLAFDLRTHIASNPAEAGLLSLPCSPATPNESPQVANSTYYGPDRSFFIRYRTGPGKDLEAVRPEDLIVATLSDWQVPQGEQTDLAEGSKVAVDPELGRMRFLGSQVPRDVGDVVVSYTYGFGADMGGGPYSRYGAFQELDNLPSHALRITVAEGGQSELPADVASSAGESGRDRLSWQQPVRTLQTAMQAWERYCATCAALGQRPIGTILILDNGRYGGSSRSTRGDAGDSKGDLVIRLPAGAQLSIIAADGKRPSVRPFTKMQIKTALEKAAAGPDGSRGLPKSTEPTALDRRLELNGLFLEGRPIEVYDERIDGFLDLVFKHCSFSRARIGVQLRPPDAQALRIQIENCIVGLLQLPQDIYELSIRDSIVDELTISGSIVDGMTAPEAGEAGPGTTLERVTILGATHVHRLKLASDVIFTRPVRVNQRDTGLIRRSYLPLESSVTSHCQHCQPDMTLLQIDQVADRGDPADRSDVIAAAAVEARIGQARRQIQPLFISTDPDHPGYAQLHPLTPPEIRGGGQAGAEMGAFHDLYQFQREANLRQALEEYLPLGKQVSVHFVT